MELIQPLKTGDGKKDPYLNQPSTASLPQTKEEDFNFIAVKRVSHFFRTKVVASNILHFVQNVVVVVVVVVVVLMSQRKYIQNVS